MAPEVTTDTSERSLEEGRHRVLRATLRVQLLASALCFATVVPFAPLQFALPIYAITGVTLLAMCVLAFAPLTYRGRARGYSLLYLLLGVGLLLFTGPSSVTFLVMCTGLILPMILLPPVEGWLFVGLTVAIGPVAAWTHLSGVIGYPLPEIAYGHDKVRFWLAGIAAMLASSAPFAALAGLLLRRYRDAHLRSEELVHELRAEVAEHQATIDALEQAQRRLTRTQKLELLGQLAGGLAHDMNNALTAIIGEASVLKESDAGSGRAITEHAEHAAQLTRQLLMLGRKDVVRVRAVDLAAEVRRAIASAQRLLPSEIRVAESYASGAATVRADPSQITQIVLNLAVNAADSMVGGGELRIRVEPSPDSADAIDLVIADTGHGIPEPDRERIFEPFFSTKPDGMGTGLGLANVKSLVESLDGRIGVDSTLGAGSQFRITLPRIEDTPQPAEPAPTPAPAPDGTRPILLVDDNEAIRRIARLILERAGHRVTVASSVSKAITWLENGGHADLVITDVVMPNESGATLVHWLRERRPELPVLVISAYTEDEQLVRGMRAGELPFLRKPFGAKELVDATREVLERERPGEDEDAGQLR